MGLYLELNLSNRWKVFLSYWTTHKMNMYQSQPGYNLQHEHQGYQHLSHRLPTVDHQTPVVL